MNCGKVGVDAGVMTALADTVRQAWSEQISWLDATSHCHVPTWTMR